MQAPAQANLSGKTVVVFGCGYVGGELARRAQAMGARVTALTRNAATAAELRAAGIACVVAELADDAWHAALPDGADAVLNAVSSGGAGLEGYARSYVGGMASILRWAAARPVGTLVYTSSTSVYAAGGGARVGEDSLPLGGNDRSDLLLEAERRLRETPTAGLGRWFILRVAGIYGPGRHHVLDQVRAGIVGGEAAHRLNLAHRDDVVAAVLACFAAPPARANEVYNVADDAPASKAEVVAWLAGYLGLPAPRFEPGAAVRRPAPPDRIIVNARLKGALGWSPSHPSFREGYASLLSHSAAARR